MARPGSLPGTYVSPGAGLKNYRSAIGLRRRDCEPAPEVTYAPMLLIWVLTLVATACRPGVTANPMNTARNAYYAAQRTVND